MQYLSSSSLAIGAGLLIASLANAQFSDDFEKLNATPAGVAVNGQGGYYNPVTGSVSFKAYTYAANALKVVANPTGSGRFVAATGPAGSVYARTQRDVPYCGDKFTLGFDILALWLGTGTAADNLGSVSQQPSTTAKGCIPLARWTTPGTTWKVSMVQYNATGGSVYSDPPGMGGLPLNKWYRWETDFDFKTNLITEIRLTDLVKNTTVKYVVPTATPWYLRGGASSTMPKPTAFRLFAGSASVAGNTLCFDNVSLTLREPATKAVANNYGGGKARFNPAGSLVVTGTPVLGTSVSFGIHNPLFTQGRGSKTQLWFSTKKTDPGLPLIGFGMRGQWAIGEVLIGSLLVGVPGPNWMGSPSVIQIPLPLDCGLLGFTAYGQGLIADPSATAKVPVALTEAVELKIGNVK
ncbi:MAG: hypothetical protein ACYTGW_19980 [Planctomycetota bacterium]|jgi:hypothetical protein